MPPSSEEIVESLVNWRLLHRREAALWRQRLQRDARLQRGERLLTHLVRSGKLTRFQAKTIYRDQGETLFLGDYVLVKRLGVGAMGQVYKARHRQRNRWAAVKVLREEWTQSPRHRERFQREARAAIRLSHPNIVATYGAGAAGGLHYLAMEFVDGANLDQQLRDRGPLVLDRALHLTLQAARGLAYAHQRGVIHRDVKPSNLLVATGDVVKILDMGIARCLPQEEPVCDRLTQSGQILGTPHYMAPEQALDPRHVSPQADIYALGCTLYRMLTGQTPYRGESDYEILVGHLRASIPAPSSRRRDVTPEVDAICRRMMAKSPDDRYFSMADVIADLEAVLAAAPGATRDLSPRDLAPLGAAAPEEETATALGEFAWKAAPRLRWRVADQPEPVAPPPVIPAESETHGALQSPPLVPPQDVCASIASFAAPRSARKRPRMRRRLWNAASAVATTAVVMGAGLLAASRAERPGWAAVEVYPTQAVVEIFNHEQDLELRRRSAGVMNFRAPPGVYRVRVTKKGFLPYARKFVLESGARTTIYAVLERE